MNTAGEWYRVLSGPHEGEWHLAGWMLSAIKGEETGSRSSGWLSYGICPRCRAMVITDENLTDNVYGDQQWAHERWHAQTDYPTPES